MPYSSLTKYCEARSRIPCRPRRVRDRIIAGIVADWPEGVTDAAAIMQVLRDRGRQRARQEYGSLLLLIIGPLIAELIRLAIQWWLENRDHRRLLSEWNAKANS
jgi:hypothetical protein